MAIQNDMILFQNDWNKYPTATIHLETTNTSFLELGKLYRDMGIKNNAFHLALINPMLKEVDPHSPNLTEREIAMIAAECKINPWYYMREVLRAPPEGGLNPRPVKANRSNIALWWLFFNHCTVYLVQPRQTGKSFNTNGLSTYLMDVRCDNTKINLLTKDDSLRRKTIDNIKEILDYLPDYLDMRIKKDANNGETITINQKNNQYATFVAQASRKAALKVARGDTAPIFHIDEAAFISNASITFQSALPAMGAAIDIAKANGTPYGVIFTTTAGKKDDPDGKYVYQQLMEAMVYDERLLFDVCSQEELEEVVRKHSRVDRKKNPRGVYRVNCTFSHRQLGYSDEWLIETMERTQSEGDDANRDYFNVWTAGNERSPISTQDAELISLSKVEKPFESDIHSYIFRWYAEDVDRYMQDNHCIMGIDTSDASGGDDIAVVISDVKTGKVIGCGNYNYTNIFVFGKFIESFILKYTNLTVIIEARSTGVGLLNYLLIALPANSINPFTRLFNRIVNERYESDVNKEYYEEAMRYGKREDIINKYKKYFGYPTSGAGLYSRESLYGGVFRKAISIAKDKIHDIVLADQILGLVIKNNRIDHDDYGHDDMVIAWLLTHWVMSEGKSLESYGITPYEIYSRISEKPIEEIPYEEQVQKYEQRKIREKMIQLYDELQNNRDYYIGLKIEQELRNLNKKLILEDHEVFSIEQLILQAKDKRKSRRYG